MRLNPKNPRRVRRILRFLRIPALIIFSIFILPVVISVGRASVVCRAWSGGPPAATVDQPPSSSADGQVITAGLQDYARREDQTYLTVPEWYIVYSADEYAAFIADNPPSHFPYLQAIDQFWDSYYDVCAVTRDQYTYNGDYHLILGVIGTSFTWENIVKGLYENTLGRLTEWTSDGGQTAEDDYARKVAAEYGTFLHTIPWYRFPYVAKLRGLWTETPFWGPNIIRKAERKVALSLEYGVKAVYASLIGAGTQSTFTPAELTTLIWAEGVSGETLQQTPELKMVKSVSDQASIVSLPRYEAFTQTVPQLAQQGVQFVEIAGNDEILLTVLAPQDWTYNLSDGEALFAMPILTEPTRKRVAVQVPVEGLPRLLNTLDGQTVSLEHIYDY